MSAGQAQVLESLLARVQKNREMPGLRLRLAHEAVRAALPSPPVAAPTTSDPGFSQEPPSTKDFGERDSETSVVEQAPITLEPVMPTAAAQVAAEPVAAEPVAAEPVAAEPVAAEPEPPTPVVDDQPRIEVAESAPEIVLDEASHDVFIEDTGDEPDTFVHDVAPEAAAAAISDESSISDEPPVSQDPIAHEPQISQELPQPPPTQARPDRDAQLDAVAAAQREPVTQAQPITDELTPDPITNPPPADTRSTGLNTAQDGFAKRPPPPFPADAPAAGSRATSATAMSEPSAAEAEIDTPAPPEAAPVLAARHAIKPKIITPQVVRSAQVAEMIGEIEAKTAADFGSILDASLSLSF